MVQRLGRHLGRWAGVDRRKDGSCLVLSADPLRSSCLSAGRLLTKALRSLWAEPRALGAPAVGLPDWLLAGAVAAATLLEGLLRPDLAWRPVVVALTLMIVPAVLWRRGRPLVVGLAYVCAVVALGAQPGIEVAGEATDGLEALEVA